MLEEMLQRYLDAGGNFVNAEEHAQDSIGAYLHTSGRRGDVVLSVDVSLGREASEVDVRSRAIRAVDGALERLHTDRLDVLWFCQVDVLADELVAIAEELWRAGKIRSVGVADVPEWYLARAVTLVEARGDFFAGVGLRHSLLQRGAEVGNMRAGTELGVGVCTAGALVGGLLTGKYRRDGRHASGAKSLLRVFKNGPLDDLRSRDWSIVELVVEVATALGRTPAQVALHWAANYPGVTTTELRVMNLDQLADDLGALDFEIPWLFADKLAWETRLISEDARLLRAPSRRFRRP
jgi:aryl-alcohol dehydrogenase-like predicted oxidoreductase